MCRHEMRVLHLVDASGLVDDHVTVTEQWMTERKHRGVAAHLFRSRPREYS
jgi:uncharacterized protein with von Willebrand factor type A (vWA) domain